MVELLRMDGVRFPDNKEKIFTRLDAIYATGSSAGIHAEGRWVNSGETDDDPDGNATIGVVFGPQYGPITAKMIEEVIKPAARRYDDLVFAGFSFDGPAQAVIDEGVPRLRMHIAIASTPLGRKEASFPFWSGRAVMDPVWCIVVVASV